MAERSEPSKDKLGAQAGGGNDALELLFERFFPIYLGEDATDRLNVRIVETERRRLVEWHVGQQVRMDNEWVDVVSYDCTHGQEVHRHVYRITKAGSRRVWRKKMLEPGADLSEALDMVLDDLCSNYGRNREKFLND